MQDDAVASTTEPGLVIQGRKTSVSLPEMLREVTVEEFLQAIERVRETQIVDNSEMESNDEMTDSSDTREIIWRQTKNWYLFRLKNICSLFLQ